ncbi:MAG: hypothetical protein ACK4FJ_16895 [Ferrovibrio sp.]|uniref:hypothetical protein n=1 Tax=Ferrovibrio sp. TaxID=1917215 RepID=UPI00391DEA79
MSSLAWGRAKREILALRPEIATLIKSGATLVEAYKILCGAGRLTVGESTFFRHAAVIRDETLAEPKQAKPPVELTAEVLAWLAAAPKPAQAAPSQQSNADEPAAATQAVARIDSPSKPARPAGAAPASPTRLPVGAGTEPEVLKFKGLKSGGDHW